MPKSYARRRRREKPIARIRHAARQDLCHVEAELGMTVDGRTREELVGTATAFANPYLCRDRDALLPAERFDLRREFFRRCLRGDARTRRERLSLAREMAPAPDGHPPPAVLSLSYPDVTNNQALQAFRARHERTQRKGEQHSTSR